MLGVDDVCIGFGGVLALDGVTLDVHDGEVLGLIGPNGAGKTSLLNCISGVYRPTRGRLVLDGTDLVGLRPHRVAARGVGRTFQSLALFPGLSVLDNVTLGRHLRMRTGLLSGAVYWGRAQREEVRHREVVERIIDFLEMEGIRRTPVGALPYGLQKRVELGRALALEPRLLLLDEPTSGMNVDEKEDIARFILDINEEMGVTLLFVSHDIGVTMDICDRVVVLDQGRKVAEGPPGRILQDEAVIQAYLGDALARHDA
ncbi:MAG TPA: ABC transporter ATP-binding protein [Acidimicrobiales bacterium]|nr:ABC transporter ATP-binding protein [Acidimicrobiales bacterium]